MTKFNPDNKTRLTLGESLGPAMEITDPQDAAQYFADYVEFQKDNGIQDAENVCRSNLGYYAGYYSDETRARVERLFGCAHPFFGSIEEKGAPTGQEAFEMGRKLAS